MLAAFPILGNPLRMKALLPEICSVSYLWEYTEVLGGHNFVLRPLFCFILQHLKGVTYSTLATLVRLTSQNFHVILECLKNYYEGPKELLLILFEIAKVCEIKEPTIKYVCKIFLKTNISNPLIHIRVPIMGLEVLVFRKI